MFLYRFVPPILSAMVLVVATWSLDRTKPSIRLFGFVVGVSAILLELCLARWFAYDFFPGSNDQTWRFLQSVSGLVPIGLLLLAQFEVLAGDDDAPPVVAARCAWGALDGFLGPLR